MLWLIHIALAYVYRGGSQKFVSIRTKQNRAPCPSTGKNTLYVAIVALAEQRCYTLPHSATPPPILLHPPGCPAGHPTSPAEGMPTKGGGGGNSG